MSTQKKQLLSGGNTSNVQKCKLTPDRKSRNWCFTLNNYTKKDVGIFFDLRLELRVKKYCFQEEKGNDGTCHLQGVISWENAISFNSVKKIHPLAHWEKCKNLKNSLAYCSKADTRNGKTYTWNYKIFNDGMELVPTDILESLMQDSIENIDSLGIRSI